MPSASSKAKQWPPNNSCTGCGKVFCSHVYTYFTVPYIAPLCLLGSRILAPLTSSSKVIHWWSAACLDTCWYLHGYGRVINCSISFDLFSLFPTMPRHNLYKIKSDVVDLCAKHGIPYKCKTLSEAFLDIVKYVNFSIFMMTLKNPVITK